MGLIFVCSCSLHSWCQTLGVCLITEWKVWWLVPSPSVTSSAFRSSLAPFLMLEFIFGSASLWYSGLFASLCWLFPFSSFYLLLSTSFCLLLLWWCFPFYSYPIKICSQRINCCVIFRGFSLVHLRNSHNERKSAVLYFYFWGEDFINCWPISLKCCSNCFSVVVFF